MDQNLSITNVNQYNDQLALTNPQNDSHLNSLIRCYNNLSNVENKDDECDDDRISYTTLIDHNWSKKILTLVSNKAKLMDSFAWLSTVGGGFSALGERDSKFSYKAGALSVGQQLHLADLLGDERLKVMCHLFVALASLQLGNKKFCINYCRRVIVPLIEKLPTKDDQVLRNMLRHITFRLKIWKKFNARAITANEN